MPGQAPLLALTPRGRRFFPVRRKARSLAYRGRALFFFGSSVAGRRQDEATCSDLDQNGLA